MDATGRRRSYQSASPFGSDTQAPQQPAAPTAETQRADFTRHDAVTLHSPRGPLLSLSAAHPQVRIAKVAQEVLAQEAMVRIVAGFLNVRELVSFARTHRRCRDAVASELAQRSHCLDAQYTALFDEYRCLHTRFAALREGRPTLSELRAVRDRVKTLGIEMDAKLLAWGELQQAWSGVGVALPSPVLTRDEGYVEPVAPSAIAIQSASLG